MMPRHQLFSMCRSCQIRLLSPTSRRAFTSSRLSRQDEQDIDVGRILQSPPPKSTPRAPKNFASKNLQSLAASARTEATTRPSSGVTDNEPYHLNVFTHKHNTHITFTEPSRNPILSYSAGNIGLRKAQRGSFDAAYQLATYTFRKMAEKQWRQGGQSATFNSMLTLNEKSVRDRGIEVLLRGHGSGREAFQKALLGTEGRIIKPLVVKVTDGTRLKFGGTRSRATRRLG